MIPLKLWSDEEYANQDNVLTISDTYTQNSRTIVHTGDTYQFLRTLPDRFAQLIVTSPPYNIGKEYEIRIGMQNYLLMQQRIIEELVRLLADTGSICWQVGNYVENGEVFPLDIFYYNIFKTYGLRLRNRIVWRYNHGLHTSKRFSGRYETILWFTKSDNYTFNLDSVRIPSKYPGKRHYKGPNRGMPSGNPLGKNPSDLWEFVAQQWEEEIWEIPQVKAAHPEKTMHPAQYPIELVERCVLALTNVDDWVLDPFCGVGSSLIAALKHNRKPVGCDKESVYINIARDRLKAFSQGSLPMRPMGKELYKPQGRVSRLPDEWKSGDIVHIYHTKDEAMKESQET